MKSVIVSAFLVLAATSAQAYQSTVPHAEICVLEAGYEPEDLDKLYKETVIFDIKEAKSVTKAQWAMLKEYYQGYYSDEQVTFERLKKDFGPKGDEAYNDLYIYKIEIAASGNVYYEVRTYPGDNPFGYVFDAKGNFVASNGDGSYSLAVSGKDCWNIIKGK